MGKKSFCNTFHFILLVPTCYLCERNLLPIVLEYLWYVSTYLGKFGPNWLTCWIYGYIFWPSFKFGCHFFSRFDLMTYKCPIYIDATGDSSLTQLYVLCPSVIYRGKLSASGEFETWRLYMSGHLSLSVGLVSHAT